MDYVSNRLRGERSQWFGYLQSLPQNIIDLPVFWGVDHIDWFTTDTESAISRCLLDDAKEATAWATGTEIDKELRRSAETGHTLLVSHDSILDSVVCIACSADTSTVFKLGGCS